MTRDVFAEALARAEAGEHNPADVPQGGEGND